MPATIADILKKSKGTTKAESGCAARNIPTRLDSRRPSFPTTAREQSPEPLPPPLDEEEDAAHSHHNGDQHRHQRELWTRRLVVVDPECQREERHDEQHDAIRLVCTELHLSLLGAACKRVSGADHDDDTSGGHVGPPPPKL